MNKSFYVYDNQNKFAVPAKALQDAGWKRVLNTTKAQVIFSDIDHPSRHAQFRRQVRMGKKIFVYPHAARPNLFNDFSDVQQSPYITANFVPGQGHAKILKTIGVSQPLEITGWYLCPLQEFQPRKEAYKVLFAPIHPNANGKMSHVDKQVNSEAYKKLIDLVEHDEIDLTVRYLQTLERNGLWSVPNVKYIQGKADQTFAEIDSADVVVTHQTMQYLAVARGVPVVGMGETLPPRMGCIEDKNFSQARKWEAYKDILAYPLDILDNRDVYDLFDIAIYGCVQVDVWRERMIGEPFDAAQFVKQVESYL